MMLKQKVFDLQVTCTMGGGDVSPDLFSRALEAAGFTDDALNEVSCTLPAFENPLHLESFCWYSPTGDYRLCLARCRGEIRLGLNLSH